MKGESDPWRYERDCAGVVIWERDEYKYIPLTNSDRAIISEALDLLIAEDNLHPYPGSQELVRQATDLIGRLGKNSRT